MRSECNLKFPVAYCGDLYEMSIFLAISLLGMARNMSMSLKYTMGGRGIVNLSQSGLIFSLGPGTWMLNNQ